MLGNGAGTFRLSGYYPTQQGPVAISMGDFNRDGNFDLAVVSSSTANVTILLGKRDGTFQARPDVCVGSGPTGLAFLGNGDGTFRNAGSAEVGNEPYAVALGDSVNYPTGTGPVGLKAGDFNKDGKVDLAVCANVSIAVLVFLGNGDGTFQI